MLVKKDQRLRRAKQTRARIAKKKIVRLCVNKTNLHTYATLFSDDGSRILVSVSTLDAPSLGLGSVKGVGATVIAAGVLGRFIAEKAKLIGVNRVAFDRSGFAYHGRIKALAEAARLAGLEF